MSCAAMQLPEDSRKLVETSQMTLWQSQGYGYLLGLQDNQVTLFDMTAVSLLYKGEGLLDNGHLMVEGVPLGRLERQSDDLMRFTEPDGTEILLNRIDAIPDTIRINGVHERPGATHSRCSGTPSRNKAACSMRAAWTGRRRMMPSRRASRTTRPKTRSFSGLPIDCAAQGRSCVCDRRRALVHGFERLPSGCQPARRLFSRNLPRIWTAAHSRRWGRT